MTRYARARSGQLSPMTRDLVMLRDRYQCAMCGGRRGLSTWIRAVGVDSPAAAVTLCKGIGTRACFDWAIDNRNTARETGWLITDGTNPETVAIVHQIYGRVTLTNRGTAIRHKEGGD